MRTILRLSLVLCLAASLFAFPAHTVASDFAPDDAPPDGFQFVEGVPVPPVENEEPAEESPRAVAAVTRYLTLTGLDFHPTDSDMGYSSVNGGLYATALVPGYGFYAACQLPYGSSVTGITFFVIDNEELVDISLAAWRYTPSTDSLYAISSETTTDSSASIQAIDLVGGLPFTISNSTYAYRLRVEFTATGQSQILYGARISYTPPEVLPPTDYITLAGADFHSNSSNMTFAAQGGTLYATAIDPTYTFQTRLDLPQGATITQVTWYVIDNHASNFYMSLKTHRPSDDSVTTPASVTSSDPSPNLQTFNEVISTTVDNSTRSYYISFLPEAASSDLRIVGARIRYTQPDSPELTSTVKTFSGVHFASSGSDLTYRALGAKLYALGLATNRSFQVSLNLPSGVHIHKITFYFVDDSVDDLALFGRYYYPTSGSYSDRVSGSSYGDLAGVRTFTFSDISIVMGVLDSYDMVSRLRVSPGAASDELLLVGATVEYLVPRVYLPLVEID